MVDRFDDPSWPSFLAALNSGKRSNKSRLDRLDTPARSMLRLRSAFGANARAEIILEMLTHHTTDGTTALALSLLGYTKRNTALVLESLVMAGILSSRREGNRVHFQVVDRVGLARVLRPLPASSGRWHLRLPLVAAFVRLALQLRGRDAVIQAVEGRKLATKLKLETLALNAPLTGSDAAAATYWPALQRWIIQNLMLEQPDARRRITGMIDGNWIGPGDRDLKRVAAPDGAILPALGTEHDQSFTALDLVQTPIVGNSGEWTWSVLSTAGVGSYTHAAALERGEQWQLISTVGDTTRWYLASIGKSLPPEDIERVYGREAASRARPDRPAVQLELQSLAHAVPNV